MNPDYQKQIDKSKYFFYNWNQLQPAKDFFKTSKNTYSSLDPRLIDVMRGYSQELNYPVYDTTERSFERYNESLGKVHTGVYRGYTDIHGGQISYYNDDYLEQVYFSPLFQLESRVKPEIFIDPMGSIKPQYIRDPITNSKYISDYSFDQDQISFREDIMASQMRIPNQQDFLKYYGSSSSFSLASSSFPSPDPICNRR